MNYLSIGLTMVLLLSCDSESQRNDACGDGVVDVGEQCDGDNLAGESCQSRGYYGGELSCNSDCTFNITSCEAAGGCGDGVVDLEEGEVCDGADLNEKTCHDVDPSFHEGTGTLSCTAGCAFDTSGCLFCGDGTLNGDEACDGDDLAGQSCHDVDPAFYDGLGALACAGECTFDTSGCLYCGDGVINGAEVCDGNDLGEAATCGQMGYAGGRPTCSVGCDDVSYASCDTWVKLSAGEDHTCGITSSGEVYCWGSGANGRLGTGTENDEPTPALVIGLPSPATDISAGDGFTCAVTGTGLLYCWGQNLYGKLGVGDTNDRLVPTAVNTTYTDFVQVSAGHNHACAVRDSGNAICWGSNANGALGRCTLLGSNMAPQPVRATCPTTMLENIVQVEAGYDHTCAVTNATDNNQVYCWGYNGFGQVGSNDIVTQAFGSAQAVVRETTTPQPSVPMRGDAVTVGGHFACTLQTGGVGEVWCWGSNGSGALGNGGNLDTALGTQVVFEIGRGTFDGVTLLASGANHTISITSDATPFSWGSNADGQSGISASAGTTHDGAYRADLLLHHLPIAQVTAGLSHSCIIDGDGFAWCFGNNAAGQLGDGSITDSATPVQIFIP